MQAFCEYRVSDKLNTGFLTVTCNFFIFKVLDFSRQKLFRKQIY